MQSLLITLKYMPKAMRMLMEFERRAFKRIKNGAGTGGGTH